jgi:hypothetical protein
VPSYRARAYRIGAELRIARASIQQRAEPMEVDAVRAMRACSDNSIEIRPSKRSGSNTARVAGAPRPSAAGATSVSRAQARTCSLVLDRRLRSIPAPSKKLRPDRDRSIIGERALAIHPERRNLRSANQAPIQLRFPNNTTELEFNYSAQLAPRCRVGR